MKKVVQACSAIVLSAAVVACSGGGGGSGPTGGAGNGSDAANFDCDGACPNLNLTEADVARVLQQGIATAQSLGVNATFAVTDRVGNVLAVYQMSGAPGTTTVSGGGRGGLEGAALPAAVAAISKAGTGAYLSSQGNAFSTRTASQIVQENFVPGERNQPGGPLFGVQFSQLICSDVNTLNKDFGGGGGGGKAVFGGLTGPRPLPLGLSADPGGIPLYRGGDVIGGLGVEFDGAYRFDKNVFDTDADPEEIVALGASIGFEAPSQRTADKIIVAGRALRYTDANYEDVPPLPEELPGLEGGTFPVIPHYFGGSIRAGAAFGTPGSGVAKTVRAGIPAAYLSDPAGNPRFPLRNGASQGGAELKADEVEALLDSALLTAFRSRAAIRRPLDTPVRVSIWVIDSQGNPLGFTRSEDAPVFGIDVSLQKARAAAFFSSADAADRLGSLGGFQADYLNASRGVLGQGAFTGQFAITNRAVGNLARPFIPDGINGNGNGPLSLPFPGPGDGPLWSPFNTGLQLDLVAARVVGGLLNPASVTASCSDPSLGRRIANGIQIFPGSVPLYRNGVLVGALGISGDGIDQDDMVCFFGASRSGLDRAGHQGIGDPNLGFNAPKEMRCDQAPLNISGLRLRYVNCPESPLIGSNDQNVCEDL